MHRFATPQPSSAICFRRWCFRNGCLCNPNTARLGWLVCLSALAGGWGSWTVPLCHAQFVANPFGGSPSTGTQDATNRSLAALDLAILAAENGLQDVSLEAVRRAVGQGPPVSAVDLGGLLSPSRQANPSSRGGQDALSGQSEVARRLVKVHEAWKAAKADPDECFELWKELIFPIARPSEAFAYSTLDNSNGSYSYSLTLAEKEPEPIPCGAAYLLQWARAAKRMDDVRAVMRERAKMPAAQGTVNLLRIMLAQEDPTETEAICQELAKTPNILINDRDAALLMSITYKMLQSMPADSKSRNQLWTAVLETTLNTQRWATNAWLKYAVLSETQESLKRGQRERFEQHAAVALSVFSTLSSGNEDYVARSTATFYGAAAEVAFDAGQLELGLDCLKRQSFHGSTTSSSTAANGLVRPNSAVTKNLLKLTPQARYDALFDLTWSLPILGLEQAAQVAPQEAIPEAFIRGYKNYQKADKLPAEQLTPLGSYSLSLLEWVIRDALELGKLDEVQARIAELNAKKSDDYALAQLVLAKVQGSEFDFDLVRSTHADGKPVLRAEVAGRGPLLPLDLEIAYRAIQNESTRAEGIELAERLAERGLQNRTNDVMQGRYLAALGRLASSEPPASSDRLSHFVVANDFSGTDVQLGRPLQAMWLEAEPGVWEHQSCAGRSSLLLKYPLKGSFEIGFRCFDRTYGESGSTMAGIYFDYRGYLNDVALNTLGLRGSETLPIEGINREELTQYTLRRDTHAGTLTILCEAKEVGTLTIGGDEFPFYGMQSMMHRKMTTHDLKITGDLVIPRSLKLLTPSLLGWSAVFRGRKLPPVDYLPAEQSGAASQSATEPSTADLPYDWHLVEERLESVDHAALREVDRAAGKKVNEPKYPPRENWMYYLRPLCDGERVDFEFYQEAGKFSVHPTIDRMAVWFDEPKIRQHWLTCDSGNWFGVNATNRINAPAENVLGQAELQEAAWNRGSLRRVGDKIVLQINGNDIYQQIVDPILGGRFGFFFDSTQFQIRLRNIELSGNWPEQLPEDLFEKK